MKGAVCGYGMFYYSPQAFLQVAVNGFYNMLLTKNTLFSFMDLFGIEEVKAMKPIIC